VTTPQLTREQKASHFRAIVDRRARMSVDWQLSPEGGEILARLIPGQPLETVLTFDVNADRADISAVAAMPDDMDFLITAVRELGAELRALRPAPAKPKDFAAECAMKCADAGFQRWLHEVHGLDNASDPVRAATRVRGMLDIDSRAKLNTDPAAADRWRRMVRDSEDWLKRTRR
jgi:hypothetical protein